MKRIRGSRPSPAMVVAVIALFVSVGGVSYGLSKNSVDSRAIKNNTIKTKDVRDGNLRGKDVRADTLTGASILEASLGKVPTAARADSAGNAERAAFAAGAGAVRGVRVDRVSFRAPDGTGPTPLYSAGGLVLTANCSPSDEVHVIATTTVNASHLYSYSGDVYTVAGELDNTVNDESFNVGESHDLLPEDDSNQVGHTRFFTKAGSTVTLEWAAEDDVGGSGSGGNECGFVGHAMQSG